MILKGPSWRCVMSWNIRDKESACLCIHITKYSLEQVALQIADMLLSNSMKPAPSGFPQRLFPSFFSHRLCPKMGGNKYSDKPRSPGRLDHVIPPTEGETRAKRSSSESRNRSTLYPGRPGGKSKWAPEWEATPSNLNERAPGWEATPSNLNVHRDDSPPQCPGNLSPALSEGQKERKRSDGELSNRSPTSRGRMGGDLEHGPASKYYDDVANDQRARLVNSVQEDKYLGFGLKSEESKTYAPIGGWEIRLTYHTESKSPLKRTVPSSEVKTALDVLRRPGTRTSYIPITEGHLSFDILHQ
ncbi:hypothetical protein F5Y15DRAFT_259847 [Xylariaceae sp. FL0016]|nr:hypothetical protein F5Y15DRAFT_259847 [Xylariaceae sp. FL0016]